jgi:hypothetical protein
MNIIVNGERGITLKDFVDKIERETNDNSAREIAHLFSI